MQETSHGEAGAIRHGLMLQMNEQLVLDYIHEHGTTSRPEIAVNLGLSAATVSRIVRRLVLRDLVHETPGVSTGGRPRTTISFNAASGCVIGIDLGGTKCHAMLADLAGELLVEEVRATDAAGSPFETLVESIDRLTRRKERAGSPVVSVAVGVPAIVDRRAGVAIGGPNVQWHGFPLVAELRQRLDVPFVVDNDVNLAALGHAWRGDARGTTDFVVLSLGTGIGAAIVTDGRLLNGRGSAAGEVGYMVLDRRQLAAPRPHDLGSFEVLASGVGIAELVRQALAEGKRSSLSEVADGPGSRDVFEAASRGDRLASSVVDTMIEHVAMAVIGIASVTDPAILILDGSVGRALGDWVGRITELVADHLPRPPAIVASSLGGEATALGAVAAALDLSRSARGPRSAGSVGEGVIRPPSASTVA